ncbi:ABC transporter permease [Bacteroides sp. 214]|uniref:ABC transporter permease n=1 Tax=Bacteroides sp. 214 TaxID=2302935 RepID=UPI0013D0A1E9|nr:ABC transporter permease [Bacteroides sp. 214]NDW13125.1 ABC transporter permease [Bacteroides sp. 214]
MRMDIDTWEEILITITRNKTRSLLTAFGVFWGIFMLIALIGGGNAIEGFMKSNFEGFASNSCFVWPQRTSKAYKGFRKGRWWNLEIDDVDRLKQNVPGIDVITPTVNYWGRTASFEDRKSTCIIKGLYPNYDAIEQQRMSKGRFINDIDILEARKVCTIGTRVYEELFRKGENPLGKFILLDGVYYRVIGVCDSEGNIQINGSASESIVIPFTTMQQTYNLGRYIDMVCVTAKPGVKITELQDDIEAIVKQVHLLAPEDKQAVMFLNAEAMFSMVDNLLVGINILVFIVGLGTLFAGAIGVSNIMMVTVKERTMEIGIRRAIGARPRDIMQQILSESMVLMTIAGLVGVSFGVLILQAAEILVNADATYPMSFQINFWTAIGATFLLLVLGMLAGLFPAYRAMGIKPIEAIRED